MEFPLLGLMSGSSDTPLALGFLPEKRRVGGVCDVLDPGSWDLLELIRGISFVIFRVASSVEIPVSDELVGEESCDVLRGEN